MVGGFNFSQRSRWRRFFFYGWVGGTATIVVCNLYKLAGHDVKLTGL